MTPEERRNQYYFIGEIFELERKVKPDFAFHIVRDAYGCIEISFFKKGDVMNPHYHHHWMRDLTDIGTQAARHSVAAHIWDSIPAECKRTDILK